MKNKRGNKNKQLLIVTYIFVGTFILLMGYFAYFNWFESGDVINSPYNARQDTFSDRIIRGKILSSDGKVLAETHVSSDGTETRNYPYGKEFAHIVGFSTKGKSGLESLANFSLLRSHAFFLERIINEFREQKNIGDNVVTTLDTKLQKIAYDALGNYHGAVVVMEPSTGKVLAMISKPDFDPNQIDSLWESLLSEDSLGNSTLLNRATQGLYPPGSIFKILTVLEYIKENPDYASYTYNCTGSITVDDVTINCYHNKAHGEQDLITSFANSCNSSFANLGLELNISSFSTLCRDFLFNSELPVSLPYNKSSFVLTKNSTTSQIMQTAIGQGETLVTPMHMALITSAIANHGIVMKPYYIDRIENYNGDLVKQYESAEYNSIISPEEANILNEFMEQVVTSGTGSKLKGQEYTVAGKTGSAEYSNEKGRSHSWFTGYSSIDKPDLAVSVIVEGAGAGSEYAVPIAKKIFDAYYN